MSKLLLTRRSAGGVAGDPDPPPGDAFFESDWSTATGTDITTALRDGGVWSGNTSDANIVQCLDVQDGDALGWTRTPNVLRMRMRGASLDGLLLNENTLPTLATDLNIYGRIFVRFDVGSGDFVNHSGTHGSGANGAVLAWSWFAFNWTASSPNPFLRSYFNSSGGAQSYPNNLWAVPGAMGLSNGVWYRYEWRVQFVSATTFRAYPEWYTLDGTLIADADDFQQNDGGQSLTAWYGDGNTFGIGNTTFRQLGLGQEGPFGASDTGRPVYFADLKLSTDGWLRDG